MKFLILRLLESIRMKIHFKLVTEIKDHYINEGNIRFETSLVSDDGDPQYRSMGDLTINKQTAYSGLPFRKRLEIGKEMLKTLEIPLNSYQSQSNILILAAEKMRARKAKSNKMR